MASSRKSVPKPKSATRLALSTHQRLGNAPRIAIALSGGLDSVVLLDSICKAYPSQTKRTSSTRLIHQANSLPTIVAFHIHHGLQKAADEWLLFCEALAKKYAIGFDFRLLHIDTALNPGNMEARARTARYEALTELCAYHGIEDLLLAHHQNDQAETVLLQLLRGAGVAGLSSMPESRSIAVPSESTNPKEQPSSITLWRPLLQCSRAELEAYAREHDLAWVEDPSNRSSQYRRNAVRKSVLPKLEAIQPGATANLARSAELLAQAQQLLDRLAQHDGQKILKPKTNAVSVQPLMALYASDPAAANNLMRYWLKSAGLAMPSQERLQAWWLDLMQSRDGTQLEWLHDGQRIRSWRGQLQVTASAPSTEAQAGEWVFVPVPAGSSQMGLPTAWVNKAKKAGAIESRQRSGAERLQMTAASARKTLKNLYQENAVPPWQRLAPLLYINGELIAVAGVGVGCDHLIATGKRVLPEWKAAASSQTLP